MRDTKQAAIFFALAMLAPTFAASAADIFFNGRYVNEKYGYSLSLPPGFALQGLDDTHGQGAHFAYPEVKAELHVWGGPITADPRATLTALSTAESEAGWILGRAEYGTDGVTLTGKKDGRHMDLRFVHMCGGTRFDLYRLEYDSSDYPIFELVRQKLEASFGPADDQRCR